ncbi:hypothetical protein O7627_00905 [Solwaraspora sp. WMMD1047]|uniref:hypothetical protein n=1 Tax=Solwaraspora sp. WMMD1047 TaxID=3016102 RepID=UPI002417EB6E|nr:hypothetical protein [Solwaraspora sp. WMMD1047]MDG4827857.1 hypothetical protein [Solwaraspora sp. WMMD1047]
MRVLRGAVATAVTLAAVLTGLPTTAASAAGSAAAAQAGADGTYRPVGPQRLLDTRSGLGAPAGALPDRRVLNLQVTARGGVPANGVSAVVLNVTVTAPTKGGYLTLYPAESTQPTASNLNFSAGKTIANSVTVPIGAGGRVAILHRGGSTHVIADVVGYYLSAASTDMGGEYYTVEPGRILDSRDPDFGGPLPGGWMVTVPVDFGEEGNAHLRALAVNVTAVSPQTGGYLTAWNGENDPPNTSTLNYGKGKIVPNMAIVPVAPCPWDYPCAGLPSISIYNGSSGGTHILIDLFGVYDDGTFAEGLRFRPLSPTRVADTRIGLGAPSAIGPNSTATITAGEPVSTPDTRALALNVTAVQPTAGTYLSVWPAGQDRPVVSTLNPAPGETVPNAAITEISPAYGFNVYNRSGSTHLVVDVAGTFEYLYPAARNPADRAAEGRLPGGAEPRPAPAPVAKRLG